MESYHTHKYTFMGIQHLCVQVCDVQLWLGVGDLCAAAPPAGTQQDTRQRGTCRLVWLEDQVIVRCSRIALLISDTTRTAYLPIST